MKIWEREKVRVKQGCGREPSWFLFVESARFRGLGKKQSKGEEMTEKGKGTDKGDGNV